jgi:hypothetical protein
MFRTDTPRKASRNNSRPPFPTGGTSTTKAAGKQLQVERLLMVNVIFLQPSHYAELKDFMTKVQLGDDSQTVLHQASASQTQKN